MRCSLADSGPCDGAWDGFVRAHPHGTFFHLAGWKKVIGGTFGHACHYLTARDGDVVTGILPLIEIRSRLFGHALISTAFCVGGGPLCADHDGLSRLLAEAEELGRRLGVSYIELRDTRGAFPGWTGRDDLYAGFEGPIPKDEQENLKQIPRKQRAVVRKAITAGFAVSIDSAIEPFYGLYARNMRHHGTPALPRRFFDSLLSTFGGDCEILTVHREGQPVSSVLSYFFAGRVLPYYTGSAATARASGANDFMYWSLMRRAAQRGCATFDFGRSKVGTGPYHFKQNWGFTPRPIAHQYRLLGRSDLPNLNPTNPRYAMFIRGWRRLPIPVANAISPFLSRSLG
jgi:FemAB-related protein (PEP-CTERM system-associated)